MLTPLGPADLLFARYAQHDRAPAGLEQEVVKPALLLLSLLIPSFCVPDEAHDLAPVQRLGLRRWDGQGGPTAGQAG